MFYKGEYVTAFNKGVCKVDDVTTLSMSGVDKAREYYILKPVYVPGSTVYVPTDTADSSMRRILSNEEAHNLLCTISEIPMLEFSNEKMIEQKYKECMKKNDCMEWARVIKTIYIRKQKRIEEGRRVTSLDTKYARLAEDNLYGELALSLNITRYDVENFFLDKMDKV